MVDVKDVRIGTYRQHEGPYYYGRHKLVLPDDHDFLDEAVWLTSRVEGAAESVNAYDRGIISVGSIQWIDRAPQLSVQELLGYVSAHHNNPQHVANALQAVLEASGARIETHGKWRFHIEHDGVSQPVDTVERQQQLYYGGSSGLKGGWTHKQMEHAKLWVASLATVFEDAEARSLQFKFTKDRMMDFATTDGKAILFNDADPTLSSADHAWVSALRSSYLTFAVNNPFWAGTAIRLAHAKSKHSKWSQAYVIECLRELVYAKGIGIYPARYNELRSHLEQLYGIDLPIKAPELKTADKFFVSSRGRFWCLKSVQRAFVKLGIDPGPIDGIMGNKTKEAIKAFQEQANLKITGVLGPATLITLKHAIDDLDALNNQSIDDAQPAVPTPTATEIIPVNEAKQQTATLEKTSKEAPKTQLVQVESPKGTFDILQMFLQIISWIVSLLKPKAS